jgi:transposase-like protein
MGLKRTNEFRKDAVRIALTSGLTRKQVADDLGVGMSTLNKWITAHPIARQWFACKPREGRHGRSVE